MSVANFLVSARRWNFSTSSAILRTDCPVAVTRSSSFARSAPALAKALNWKRRMLLTPSRMRSALSMLWLERFTLFTAVSMTFICVTLVTTMPTMIRMTIPNPMNRRVDTFMF